MSVRTETYAWTRKDGSPATAERYIATATINGKRVRRVSLKSKTDAVRRIEETKQKSARGLPPTDRRIRAQHIFDDWLATKRTAGRKPRTLKRYQQLVDIHLGPGLGHLTLEQLQVDATVQSFFDERKAWRDERGRGLSARTVQAIHDALRAAVNLAIKRGYMHRNAVGRTGTVEIPRPRRKVHVPLSFEESEAFLAQALGHRHEHLYHLLLTTGVRLGETLAIRIRPGADTSWADMEQGILHIRETLEPLTRREAAERGRGVRWHADDLKGERYRDVPRWRDIPLTVEAVAAIKAQQLVAKTNRLRAGKAWHDHGFLFVDEIGEPFTQSNVNHICWGRYARARAQNDVGRASR